MLKKKKDRTRGKAVVVEYLQAEGLEFNPHYCKKTKLKRNEKLKRPKFTVF
jgi:hypothetical protein